MVGSYVLTKTFRTNCTVKADFPTPPPGSQMQPLGGQCQWRGSDTVTRLEGVYYADGNMHASRLLTSHNHNS